MTEIAILSGKGGTGKTSLSAAFATLGKEVVVADCDVEASNLYLILQPENYHEGKYISGQKAMIDYQICDGCGLCIEYCRFRAISMIENQVTISETACDGCMLCMRICPQKAINMVLSDKSNLYEGKFRKGLMVHARLEPGEENSGKLVSVVRKQALELSKQTGWETIIIDGPPGIGCPAISSVTGVRKVVIVTEPTRSGFHDMKRILELTGNFKIKSYVVINKYDLNLDITNQIADWCFDRKIPVTGKIPFEPRVVEAMLNCKSITEWFPGSEASNEIIHIWNKIISDE
jgi:MinD superfamily P-loop ATPase